MKRYALFSVNDTRGIVDFARTVTGLGWGIIATAKPYEILRQQQGMKVTLIDDFVEMSGCRYGFPPTLHPKVEHALTDESAVDRIELVYDITYGLDVGNDVGGHTLLALAAKGGRLPVTSYEDMVEVSAILAKDKSVSSDKRAELMAKANMKIAAHYAGLLSFESPSLYNTVTMKKNRELLNGENPYQVPSDLMATNDHDPLALHAHQLLTDNVPCFTNMADMDCLVETLCKLALAFECNKGRRPYIAVAAKHGNACGIGVDWEDPGKSIHKALWGNPLAIWGGEVVVNFPLSREMALLLYSSAERERMLGSDKWMQDVILAPEVDSAALSVLNQRKNTKVFVNPALAKPQLSPEKWQLRHARGSVLRQPAASYLLDLRQVRWVGGTMIDERALDSLILAWGCAFTSNHGGNEVAIAGDGSLLGVGGGPSTVEAAEMAVLRSSRYAKHLLPKSVFAADAFFPFTDAPEILSQAGCIGGVVPAGGIREQKVIEFFSERKMQVAFLNEDIRGFCRH